MKARLSKEISQIARFCYERGWALGTSGNYSAVLREKPLRLAITASGVHKGDLRASQILVVDGAGHVVQGRGRPSDETPVHLTIVSERGARSVLHSHSVASTILSDAHAGEGRLGLEGYEMLKGLRNVTTHQHLEWIPILENSQDYRALATLVREELRRHPKAHALLLRSHGLYTWGRDVSEARRHLEILEFLLDVKVRLYCAGKTR